MTHNDKCPVKSQKAGFLRGLLGLVCLMGLTPSAQALVTADVLPKGVRAGAFVWGKGVATDSFNEEGKRDSLTSPANRSITLQDLAEAEPQLNDLEKILNGMNSEQLGSNLFVSNIYSGVEVVEQRYVTGLLWGISDRLSLGLIVPVVNRNVSFNFDVDTVNNAQAIKDRLGYIPQLSEGLQEFIDAGINKEMFIDELLLKNGYQEPRGYSLSALGDIEIESRFRYYKSEQLDMGVRANLVLPTANHEVDLSNILDQEVGKGVYSLRVGSVNSYRIIPYVFSVHGAVFGTYNLPTQQTVALPMDPSQPLANLNDPSQIESVRKVLGPSFKTDLGVMYDINKGGISLMASYIFEASASDSYQGNRGLDYARLMENTASVEHAFEFTAEFSSVPAFLEERAIAPAKLAFTWYQPIAGRNVIFAPYGRIDAILLF